MKPPQQYTSAEIKMIDRARKYDWKRRKKIVLIIIISLSILTLVLIFQQPMQLKNLHEASPLLITLAVWLCIYDSYKFFELIKKLAKSNVDNDQHKP